MCVPSATEAGEEPGNEATQGYVCWFIATNVVSFAGGKLQRKIMRERERREHDKPDLLYAKDSHALPYTAFGRTLQRKKLKEFNKLGFGAGGLPPLSFSHANRNWTQLPGGGGRELLLSGGVGGGREEGQEVYGPGMSLAHLPQMRMQSGHEEDEDSEVGRVCEVESGERRAGGEASLPPAKRLKLASRPSLKAAVVRVPSSQVRQHEGGRGQKRMRAKRAIEGEERMELMSGVGSYEAVTYFAQLLRR